MHVPIHKTDGPLFRGRFKAILVDSEHYLLQLNRYIHLNPVKANLVKLPEQYQWSSYATYIKPNLKPYWLHTTETLKRHDATESIKKFQQFTNAGVDQATLNFFTKSGLPPILGSLDFIKKISDKYLPLIKNNTEISDQRLLTEVPNIAMIMQATSDFFNIPTATLTTVQRKTGNYPRKLAIYLAHELSNQSIQTIANHFKNTTYSGVSKAHLRVKNGITKNTALANDINLITDLLMSYVKTISLPTSPINFCKGFFSSKMLLHIS